MGFMIRAYAYKALQGYLPEAIVFPKDDVENEIEVSPPRKIFEHADEAIETAIYWARDRVDELYSGQNQRQAH